MTWPTREEVEAADVEQLARWYRFLPDPTTKEHVPIWDFMFYRFWEAGGMTGELSRKIGWQP